MPFTPTHIIIHHSASDDGPKARVLGHNEVPGVRTACLGEHLDMKKLRRAV